MSVILEATLAARVRLVISRLVLIFVLPLDFHGLVRVVRSMYLLAALHGVESSLLALDSLRNVRSSVCGVVWSRRQPLRACCCATTGALVGSCRKLWSLRSCSFGCRPVLGQGCCARWCNDWGSRSAWFDDGYMFCVSSRKTLGRISHHFPLEGVDSAPELDSRPAGTSSTTAVACSLLVLLVLTHFALCSHDCRQSAVRCFRWSRIALGNLYIIFNVSPVFFSIFHVRNFARVDFLEPSSTHRCECSRAGGWR